jgi:hypothetical protein
MQDRIRNLSNIHHRLGFDRTVRLRHANGNRRSQVSERISDINLTASNVKRPCPSRAQAPS